MPRNVISTSSNEPPALHPSPLQPKYRPTRNKLFQEAIPAQAHTKKYIMVRRKSGPGPARQTRSSAQSTLAFHGHSNKVTKSSSLTPSNKTKKDPALLEPEAALPVKAPAEPDLDEPTTHEISIIDQAQEETAAPLTTEEEEALGVSESHIQKYWREKERERKAPRMHQEDVPLYERICREWDTDGRFGVSKQQTLFDTYIASVTKLTWIIALHGHR